ncbi:toxin-antitoxin system HicB family antitoxin [Rickettsiella endosymbiont of Dermanyssus gallinae]|uniref:toxin-antitoxin system HicB family antitoxin n=1 Tax=Rickettsiella endosymbiont of Dermanyssus gallinae TaxID=2856608 RepID=UPI001C52A7CB|nr:toxin-antitoxin system HicB family antitoxin [Rickettsiella endosymbiont of Dermanyssus gallinae]
MKDSGNKAKLNSDDPIIRMNVGLSKSLHKALKRRALDEDISVNALAVKALKKYIEK